MNQKKLEGILADYLRRPSEDDPQFSIIFDDVAKTLGLDRWKGMTVKAFLNYIAKGVGENNLASFETKALDIINSAEGGFMVPPELADRIVPASSTPRRCARSPP